MARLKPIWLELRTIAARVRVAEHMMVASDYDGTLSPIASHPDRAGLPPRTRSALASLARAPGVELAFLSGRRLADVRRHIGIRGAFYSGVVGLETQSPGEAIETHVPRGRELPGELRARLEAWTARHRGAWVEDKRWSLAVHYRHVVPDAQAGFRAGMRRVLRPYRSATFVIHGKKVFEVLPAARWNKAVALERWWRAAGKPSSSGRKLLIFLGDDENDEPAHAYVRKQGGLSIAVGRKTSKAEYVLDSSDEVTWWLEWLERERKAR